MVSILGHHMYCLVHFPQIEHTYRLLFMNTFFTLYTIWSAITQFVLINCIYYRLWTGQVGLGVESWPSNRATEGSNPK